MEDLEKYLFDPKNPKGFKSYKLLAEIIRRGRNIASIDYYFFIELFKKEIFTNDFVDKLWDKPDNFNELTPNQKASAYIRNYSITEFTEFISNRLPEINTSSINKLFNEFIYFLPSFESFEEKAWARESSISDSYIQNLITVQFMSADESVDLSVEESLICFVSKEDSIVLEKLTSSRSSVLIATQEVYHKISDVFLFTDFRPIILKQASDVHALLDLVKREVRQTKDSRSIVYGLPKDIALLRQVEIKNYFSVQSVKLSKLAKQQEIYLVGENGDGKTLLLQAILLGLKDNRVTGVASDYISENPTTKLSIKATDANEKEYHFTDGLAKHPHPYDHIFAYGINRFRNDSDQKEEEGYLTLFSHEQYLENPVKWLQNIDYREKSGEGLRISLEMAKEILRELLDENVTIEVSPDKVIFNERGTEVTFNQLSDGYKSVIIWISDLIARLSEKQPYVSTIQDFRGIVLVDEIGVYLHPKWQYKIVRKLRSWFPHIQFIFTTHSPIVIMGASKDATFYKVYKESGVTKVSDAVDAASIANLMANGIVTSPLLFGLADARPAAFDENKGELDTSDDYLSGKIHQAITKHIQDRNNVTENEIMTLIQQELDKATTPQ